MLKTATETAGRLVFATEAVYKLRIVELAEMPFEFDDAKGFRKFTSADGAFSIDLAEALRASRAARRVRNQEKSKARERKGFMLAQRTKARQLREQGR